MESRFYWDADRIAFFRDAAEYGDFFRLLAERIAPAIRPEDRVLDAGCGLGYLSEALLPYCKTVTAVDRDERAIAELVRRTAGKEGIVPMAADVHMIPLPFDVIVCCRFGSTEESLAMFDRSEAETLVLIKRSDPAHRISGSPVLHTRTAKDAVRILKEQERCFSSSAVSLSFDQPFRSESDALRFFRAYRVEPEKTDEQRDLRRLTETNDPQFPLVLPVRHELTVFLIRKG